jgi:hypothetical protein
MARIRASDVGVSCDRPRAQDGGEAGVRLEQRGDEHETGNRAGIGERELERDRGAHARADDDAGPDAEAREQRARVGGEVREGERSPPATDASRRCRDGRMLRL